MAAVFSPCLQQQQQRKSLLSSKPCCPADNEVNERKCQNNGSLWEGQLYCGCKPNIGNVNNDFVIAHHDDEFINKTTTESAAVVMLEQQQQHHQQRDKQNRNEIEINSSSLSSALLCDDDDDADDNRVSDDLRRTNMCGQLVARNKCFSAPLSPSTKQQKHQSSSSFRSVCGIVAVYICLIAFNHRIINVNASAVPTTDGFMSGCKYFL